jgi:hypothetical protein
VDWKRLVQFALRGSGDLDQYAILPVRVSLGLFFAISGANKLFVASSTQTMYETLVEAKSPVSPVKGGAKLDHRGGAKVDQYRFGPGLGQRHEGLGISARSVGEYCESDGVAFRL